MARRAIYRPRRPEASALYQCPQQYWEEFQQAYTPLYEKDHGPLRPVVETTVERFLECGILRHGFARIRCGSRHEECLPAFSCKTRYFCPSRQAKRVAAFMEWVTDAGVLWGRVSERSPRNLSPPHPPCPPAARRQASGERKPYQPLGETRPIWTENALSRDTVLVRVLVGGEPHTSNQATIWRWRRHYQHDFAARMDWRVAEDPAQANHNPVAVLNGDRSRDLVRLTTRPGETVRLSADGSGDPDGHGIAVSWMVYPEAGMRPPLPRSRNGYPTAGRRKRPRTRPRADRPVARDTA